MDNLVAWTRRLNLHSTGFKLFRFFAQIGPVYIHNHERLSDFNENTPLSWNTQYAHIDLTANCFTTLLIFGRFFPVVLELITSKFTAPLCIFERTWRFYEWSEEETPQLMAEMLVSSCWLCGTNMMWGPFREKDNDYSQAIPCTGIWHSLASILKHLPS